MMMMMKNCLPELVLLLLSSTSTVSGLGSVLQKTIDYETKCYTWEAAQAFCRSSYTDLIVLYNQVDVNNMYLDQYVSWIGLQEDGGDWVWSNGHRLDLTSVLWPDYYHPNSDQSCAYVSYEEKRFRGAKCAEYNFFICNSRDDDNKYMFVNKSMTWSDARDFCQSSFEYLAIIKDNNHLRSAVQQQDFPVWTGLYRDEETWMWSTGGSGYRNWAPNEPGNSGDCVAIYSVSKKMVTQNCSARYPFLCFRDNLLLVKENKTWEEALDYCNNYISPNRGPYQLVSVQPGDEHRYMMNRVMDADTDEVWTGLRYLAGKWFWANGADMLLPGLPGCPLTGQHCGGFSKNDSSLGARDCLERKNFLCYSQW